MSDMLGRIDDTITAATVDAARWTPEPAARTFTALLIPVDPDQPLSLVDLGPDSYSSARQHIGGPIEKLTIDGAGHIGLDFLFDEEGNYRNDPQLNVRATALLHTVKMAQAADEYPAPDGSNSLDLLADAVAWAKMIRLVGTVVVVGADDRDGEWVPVPDRLIEFASEEVFGVEIASL